MFFRALQNKKRMILENLLIQTYTDRKSTVRASDRAQAASPRQFCTNQVLNLNIALGFSKTRRATASLYKTHSVLYSK